MNIPFFKKKRAAAKLQTDAMNPRSIRALAILILLAQLPHVLHLPLWVSIMGCGVVALKLFEEKLPKLVKKLVLSSAGMTVVAILGAVLIKLHFGYMLGRDPCVALLFILVSAKFAEIRKTSDAVLLMCLACFLLLTQYFYSQSFLSALITLPAVFALGNALAVVRDPRDARPAQQNIQLVVKLLLQGAPLALFLFLLFPRLPGPLWSLPDDATAKTGLSDSMAPGTISSLSLSDAVAFRVDFQNGIPTPAQRYWRGPVLSDFDGRKWQKGERSVDVIPPESVGTTLDYTVTLQPNQQNWLFALDHPTTLPSSNTDDPNQQRVLGRLTGDHQLLSLNKVSSVMQYRQQSSLSSAYRPAFAPTDLMTQTAGVNVKTEAFANKLRKKHRSDTAYANAVLEWFNQEDFHYTLQPSLLGDTPVDEFLFGTKRGFCEHYASAFVVLLRAASIPARVVTGYLGGEMNGDYMIVRQSDAHAWTEAYINGRWQRYDPTAAVAPQRVEQGMAAALPDDEPVPRMARNNANWLKNFQLSMDKFNHQWQRMVVDFNNHSQTELWEKLGFPKPKLWHLTLLVLLISGVWCVFILGLPLRNSGQTKSGVEKLWDKYCAVLNQQGIQRLPDETAHQFVYRAAKQSGSKHDKILQLGLQLIRLRFEPLSKDKADHLNRTLTKQLRRIKYSF